MTLSTAIVEASLQRVYISAPTYPGVSLTISSYTNVSLNLIFLVNIFMISILSSSFGTPILNSRSNLPALLKAESMVSGLLVQPMRTIYFSPWLKSSMQDAIQATILTSRSFQAFSLFPAIESSSSIKIIAGSFSAIPLKKFLIFSSD